MDTNYGKSFFDEYDVTDYKNRDYWYNFFDAVAAKLVDSFTPKTLLDAGCAMGYLVEALRKRGVEAYGIDISNYAIESAAPEVREFLNVQSITDPLPESFPKKFDMVISIEVLEHLFPEDGKKAIEALCSYTDTFLFTSTPDDIDDKNHLNVQQKEYWAKIFAENSFYRDLVQPVDFVAPWALLFRRKDNIADVIFNYEMVDRIDKTRANRPKAVNATVFFGIDGEYSADLTHEFTYYGSDFKSGRIQIPSNCTSIRLDTVEDAFSLVSELSVVTNNGLTLPKVTNAEYEKDGIYYFTVTDPQLYFDVSGAIWIEISAKIDIHRSFTDFAPLAKLVTLARAYEAGAEKYASLEKTLADTKAVLSAVSQDKDSLYNGYRDAVALKDSLEAEREILRANVDTLSKEHSALVVEYNRALELKSEAECGCERLSAEIAELSEKIKMYECSLTEKTALADKLEKELREKSRALEKAELVASSNDEELTNLRVELAKRQSVIDELERVYKIASTDARALTQERDRLTIELAGTRAMYENVAHSFFWKITKPARLMLDLIKKPFKK